MRGAARFATARRLARRARQLRHRRAVDTYCDDRRARAHQSVFVDVDPDEAVATLRTDGVAFGLDIPRTIVDAIVAFARHDPVYADRDPRLGFPLDERPAAEHALGKPILVAQHFNVAAACPEVARLASDPVLELIAARYLGSVPVLVGTDMWWTFPVDASAEDRHRHAHLFHRDVDDFAFVKFFFYLTDVDHDDGPHVIVTGSHRRPPVARWSDRLVLRRYSDAEIAALYPATAITTIVGAAGTGFAEDTLCVHKGSTPTDRPRLLLQFEYALHDYEVMHDERPAAELARVV
jgi:hypothetical protein